MKNNIETLIENFEVELDMLQTNIIIIKENLEELKDALIDNTRDNETKNINSI